MTRARAAVLLFSAASAGCIPAELRTIEIPTEKEVEIPGEQIVPGNPLLPEQVFPSDVISEALAAQMQESFATNDVDKDAVDSLKLTKLRVEVTDPEENGRQLRDLGFLRSAAFFLGAEGVDPVRVADSEEGAFDADPAPTSYDFRLTDEELAPVLKAADALDMTADVQVEGRPQFTTVLLFEVVLTVVVNPVGALNGK